MIYSIIIILVALEKSNVVIYVQYVMDISLQLGLGSTVIKKTELCIIEKDDRGKSC